MDNSRPLAYALTLLGGELRDSAGELLTPAANPVVHVQRGADARRALAAGRRVAMTVPLTSSNVMTRLIRRGLARLRIRSAQRRLAAGGASRVRAFAIVSTGDRLFAAYEIGETIQPYVENYILLEPSASAPARATKSLLRTLSGTPTSVDLVIVVGERA
jgi:hypothetical protein